MDLGGYWRRRHASRPLSRWAGKTFFVLVVLFLILYPRVWMLPTWIDRVRHADQLIDPKNAHLAPLEERVRAAARDPADVKQVYRVVESTVYQAVPYAFDWDVWGVMDWIPTVDEVFQKGREDCDGRAVVAASLLRRMGYEASLTTDLKHVWVHTPQGDLMSPGTGHKVARSERGGTRVEISKDLLLDAAQGVSFSLTVFPLTRLLILLVAIAAATMHPWSSPARRVAGCVILLLALGLLRDAGPAARDVSQYPWMTWGGFALAAGGWLLLAWRSRPGRVVGEMAKSGW